MSTTRGEILDYVQTVTGDDSSQFRTYLEKRLDKNIRRLWLKHDWEFRHKSSSFTLVADQEEYDLTVNTPDIKSSHDIEVMYNFSDGHLINKTDLKDIRKRYPEQDQTGQPIVYAPWGTYKVYLHEVPDTARAGEEIRFLYLSKAITPTDDADDLEVDIGIPDSYHHIIEQMTLSDGYIYIDDSRYQALRQEVESVLLPEAVQDDMKHLESTARFKFWEEEISPNVNTSEAAWLRQVWWGDN